MTERDEGPGTGRGHLRAANIDRERVVAALQAAFVQGRLDKDELDARVGQAFASRTYAELAALTVDLPTGPADVPVRSAAAGTAAAEPSRTPAQTMAKAAYRSAICLFLSVALVEGAFLTGFGGYLVLGIWFFVGFITVFGYGAVDTWHEWRDLRQRPGPGQRGRGGPDGRDRRDGQGLKGGRPGLSGRDPASPDVRADGTGAEVRTRRTEQRRRHPSGGDVRMPRGTAVVPGPA